MKFRLGLFFGFAIPLFGVMPLTAAASPSGMQAMQYYVGLWNCTGGAIGHPTVGSMEYVMDGSALRSTVFVRTTSGKPSRAWLTVETKYDAANHRYVDTSYENGGWDESWASPFTGNSEQWVDHSTADGKLGRDVVVRVNHNEYIHTAYASLRGSTVSFKVKCVRAKQS